MVGTETVMPGRSVHLASILRAQYSAAKVSLPVDSIMYARLKHVQGVPDRAAGGFSLTKLQMIDLMVERLTRLRGEPVALPRPANEAEADRVLASLASNVSREVQAGQLRSVFAAAILEPGMLVNLVA